MRNVLIWVFLLLWISLLSGPLKAQNLSVANIPEALTKGANSVVRESKVTYSIIDGKRVNIRECSAITIMNLKALPLAHLKIFYNTTDKLNIINATIYNANGQKTKVIKRSEMKDYSAAGDATMYSDQRVVFCQVVPITYPFTVVYEYEITYNQLYGIKTFSPYSESYQSVEKATYTLESPNRIPLNINEMNLPPAVDVQKTEVATVWTFTNLPPLTEESFSPDFSEIIPAIRIAPEDIIYKKYSGKADNWENYGSFLAQLSKEDKGLSPEAVERLKQMTAGVSDTREKVKIIYKYMQSRTHYINISLGIGSIQPHPAAQVDALGYGDCKDLSTYMIAMLNAVDVEACYAVIKAGEYSHFFIPELPNHQFNHAIVCVPNHSDTLWLECTSQVMPFAHLGSFTDNRYALLVKETGSKLVKTPEYGKKENYIYSNFTLENTPEGTSAKGNITYGGLLMDDVTSIPVLTRTEQLSWIDRNLEIADFSVVSHRFKSNENAFTNIVLDLELGLKSYFSGSNNRLFIPLNLNNKISVPARLRSRKYPLDLPYAFHTADTLTIKIPAGYSVVDLPQGSTEDERFGNYSMKTTRDEDTITCIRTFELNKGRHAPELYSAFYEFMQKASLADVKPLVLMKEE